MSQLETNANEVAVAISIEKIGFYEGFNRVVALVRIPVKLISDSGFS